METSIAIVTGLIDLLKTGGWFGLVAFIVYVVCQLLKIVAVAGFGYLAVKHLSNTLLTIFGK